MILDIIQQNADLESLRDSSAKNTITIMKAFNRFGVNLLANINSRTAQNTSSATYSKINDFQTSFETSGGLIVALGSIYGAMNDGNIRVFVDDEAKKTIALENSGAVNMPILWIGSLPKGRHTIGLKFNADSGTSTVGATAIDSYLYVVEFLNG